MDFLKELNKYKEDIIKHTMELVKIPSELVENEVYEGKTYRFGYQNKKALDYYLNLAESLGFKTKNIEDICGHVEYGPENENNEIQKDFSQESKDFFKPIENVAGAEISQKLYSLYDNWYIKK